MSEFVTIAYIVKTRGIRGEVVADILTDIPDRFDTLDRVRIVGEFHESWEELESFWFQKGRVILKFVGRNRPDEVQELVACEVQLPEEERVELPEDYFYDSDLVGCRVFQGEEFLGEVTDLLKVGGESTNLVVVGPEGREVMIPLVRAFVTAVDLQSRTLQVDVPPGLLDLAVEPKPRKKGRDRS